MQIEGQKFPAHEHREYPRVVYRDGLSHVDGKPNESRTVANAAEEEEAAADGFSFPVSEQPDAAGEEASDGSDETALAEKSKKGSK